MTEVAWRRTYGVPCEFTPVAVVVIYEGRRWRGED